MGVGARGRDDKIIRTSCDADTSSSMMDPSKRIRPTTSMRRRRMIVEDDDEGEHDHLFIPEADIIVH